MVSIVWRQFKRTAQSHHLLVYSPSLGLELNAGRVRSSVTNYHCALKYSCSTLKPSTPISRHIAFVFADVQCECILKRCRIDLLHQYTRGDVTGSVRAKRNRLFLGLAPTQSEIKTLRAELRKIRKVQASDPLKVHLH